MALKSSRGPIYELGNREVINFAQGESAADLDQLITFWETFEPDIGGTSRKKWDSASIAAWYEEQGYFFAINDMSETLTLNNERMDDTKRAKIRNRREMREYPSNTLRMSR